MMRTVMIFCVGILLLLGLHGETLAAGPPISSMTGGNKHNLSSLNVAPQVRFKASSESTDPRAKQICIFCHTPHHASSQLALWNRRDPTRKFGHYSSATLVIDDPDVRALTKYGEPNGSARLCLSCHDGETALGAVANGSEIAFDPSNRTLPMMNYSGHHPVSFVYDQNVLFVLSQRRPLDQFMLPPAGDRVKLDAQQRMQCTSCHDPHQDWLNDDEVVRPPFWVGPTYNAVCETCHRMTNPNL